MITIDVSRLNERESAHAYLQDILALPKYYGKNLDALYDCLTTMSAIITFENTDDRSACCDRILDVFRDAEIENPDLVLLNLPDSF